MSDQSEQIEQQGGGSFNSALTESVRELIGMMTRAGLSELDLSDGNVSIHLRGAAPAQVVTQVAAPAPITTTAAPLVAAEAEPEGHIISSPMIGTFYAAPAPGEADFVQLGDEIEAGQVIGIIEAMKIMNEIVADQTGVLAEIIVDNAQPVEFGSPLMRVVAGDAIG